MILFKFATEIKGLSSVEGHAGWLNAESLQFGVGRGISSQSGGGGRREVSSPSISEVVISRSTDLASPELFFQACGGVSLGTCTINLLQVVANKPQIYVTILLEEALLSSFSISAPGDTTPSESISINFSKVSYQYDTFDGKKITTGTAKKWDLSKNVTY